MASPEKSTLSIVRRNFPSSSTPPLSSDRSQQSFPRDHNFPSGLASICFSAQCVLPHAGKPTILRNSDSRCVGRCSIVFPTESSGDASSIKNTFSRRLKPSTLITEVRFNLDVFQEDLREQPRGARDATDVTETKHPKTGHFS